MTPLMTFAARRTRLVATILIASVLSACGGGSGSGSEGNSQAAAASATPLVDGDVNGAVGQKVALARTVNADSSSRTLTVRARGTLAGNLGPQMQVLIDGVLVGSTEVRSADFADYRFNTPPLVPGTKVDVVFTNDAVIGTEGRDLFVDYLIAGKTSVLPTAAGATYDIGAGAAAFDGINVVFGRDSIYTNGVLRLI